MHAARFPSCAPRPTDVPAHAPLADANVPIPHTTGVIPANLWSESDIQHATEFYRTHFIAPAVAPTDPDAIGDDDVAPAVDLTDLTYGEVGTSEVRNLTLAKLQKNLGIDESNVVPNMRTFEKRVNAKPEQWGDAKDPAVITEAEYPDWIKTVPAAFRNTPAYMLPPLPPNREAYRHELDARNAPISVQLLRPHTFQIGGCLALLRIFFRARPNVHDESFTPYPGPPSAVFFADIMGLGKTFTTAMTIAMVAHLRSLQSEGKAFPPWLGELFASTHVRFSRYRAYATVFSRHAVFLRQGDDPRDPFPHRRSALAGRSVARRAHPVLGARQV